MIGTDYNFYRKMYHSKIISAAAWAGGVGFLIGLVLGAFFMSIFL